MSVQFEDNNLRIIKVAHMGPVDNNGYILSCRRTGDAVIIDAPAEPEKLLGEVGDSKIKAIIITHRHGDHTAGLGEVRERTGASTGAHPEDAPAIPGQTAGLGEVRERTGASTGAHPEDAPAIPGQADFQLKDGDTYQVGEIQLKALHTPGHTPGGICLVVGNHVFSGDTLFPGGPGATRAPEDFRQVVNSIRRKLMPLPDETAVYPGHGDDTTIGNSREEIKTFDSRSHPDDLCGHVQWLNS